MRVNNIYPILQGEGVNSGVPQLMLRLQGCPLFCSYCDQLDALSTKGGTEYSVGELRSALHARAHQYNLRWLCVSGGEPLLQAEELGELLKGLYLEVEVETSGYFPPPEWWDRVHCWVVDFKCPSSGVESKSIGGWISALRKRSGYLDQIKFVVQTEEDLDFALKNRVPLLTNVLSPVIYGVADHSGRIVVSREQTEWNRSVAMFALRHNFRFSLQLHKFLWGDRQDV